VNGPLRTELASGFTSMHQLMSNSFFDHPILNEPYGQLSRHWELVQGRPNIPDKAAVLEAAQTSRGERGRAFLAAAKR